MSAKAIREFDGKHLLAYWLPKQGSNQFLTPSMMASLDFDLSLKSTPEFEQHVKSVFDNAEKVHPWLKTTKLVCKPDQLIKRRGKNGLLGINLDWEGVKKWVGARAGTSIKIEKTSGYLTSFIVEPFCPHPQDSEYYICIQSVRQGGFD